MPFSIGISIGRRSASVVAADGVRRIPRIVWAHRVPRPAGQSAAQTLAELLRQVPPDYTRSPAAIVLSPGDLACADAVDPPPGLAGRHLARLGPALCESRCAGESAEDLAVDLVPDGVQALAVAMRTRALDELRAAAADQGIPLTLVTAAPIALGHALDGRQVDLTAAGERIRIERIGERFAWRASPAGSTEDQVHDGILSIRGVKVPPGQAAALAAAVADPDAMPNLLSGLPGSPRSAGGRYRKPLSVLCVAATLLFIALGVRSHRDARVREAELAGARRVEAALWGKFLPGRPPRESGLLQAMRRQVAESGPGRNADPAAFASALACWAEIARHLPDADETGMTLDSLDLSPEEGRLGARVAAAQGDPLKNAALIEERLNRSDRIRARGDYETREKEVIVRLRMAYKPDPGGAGAESKR